MDPQCSTSVFVIDQGGTPDVVSFDLSALPKWLTTISWSLVVTITDTNVGHAVEH
jgi:hypothetical protein